ncbi:RING/FYVE/PHD zinc finger superfamily protein [Rhynchospora pubera]|uniref:RING/FYVE/PHD zinc finger superfamily protein n=1 Tax=Rhynchospora pubera TaxID=906938 RepID=A0AAV8F057_9POAL|nr:RING/FYVE/PHD zinc finger superfamily protein [Rhynchospora pubera]
MGDEGSVEIPSPPAAKRLKRVAEVVMVLSGMAEMRGGRDPTPVEKAMAAEARESLTGLCEKFKPKDLFSREAVRAVVEDLGLNKDAGMGFRPPRVSIVDRILQTKRKLEGPKEVLTNQYYPPQHVLGASQISIPGGGHHTQPISGSVQTRRSQMNEKPSGMAVSSHLGAIPRPETPHLRHNGMAHLAQARAQKAANPQVHPDQREKSMNHMSLRSNSTPHGINSIRPAQNNEIKPPTVQPGPSNLLIGLPAPQGITFVTTQSLYPSHGEISKKVQQLVLAQRDSTHPSWTPPSTEYMNKPLICQVCNFVVTDVDSLLICDSCERGTHLRCLEVNGTKVQVPKAEWHCQKCVAASHGKALPPKYGKVTRTVGAAKPTPAVRKENPQLKDGQKKTMPNGIVTNQPNTVPGVISRNLNNVQVVSNNPKDGTVTASTGTGVENEKHLSQNGQSGKGDINDGKSKESSGEKEEALPEQQLDKADNQANGVVISENPAHPEICWVGDAGEVIDGKSYYSSCCINKTTYKLQDHAVISYVGGRFIPSKIKSLWEGKEPGSKWAVVNPYYIPSDLPESVSFSSGGVEDNEVYASDNKETININLISGPCEVLTSDRFQEETERRCQLSDSSNNLPPIFVCRWKYDDTNGILRPLTN